MTTQIEQIVWHKYPEEKPTEEGRYLLQLKDDPIEKEWWDNDEKKFVHSFIGQHSGIPDIVVIAWAEIPTGWKETK